MKLEKIVPKEDRRIYFEERVPADFQEGRIIRRVEDYLFEAQGKPLTLELRGSAEDGFENKEAAGAFM